MSNIISEVKKDETSRLENDSMTEAQIEGTKLLYDYTKHLTTLSTGSIVILATFVEKIAQQAHWRILAALSVGGFIVCILGNTIVQGVLALRAEQGNFSATTGAEQNLEGISFLVAGLAFLLSLGFLAAFAIRNLL